MLQFDSPHNLPTVEPSPARLETPLGTLAFQAFVEGERTEPFARFGAGLPCLRQYRLVSPRADWLRADLLLFALDPAPPLPEGLRVDALVAAVWRVRALRDLPPTTLRAAWEPGARVEEGSYDCGEHLTGFTWDAPGVRLSVGTSDEEMLAVTATRGELIPPRLAEAFAKDEGLAPRAIGERNGLKVRLPPLNAGEGVQVHFLVAWRTGEFDALDVSSWYAVDLTPAEVASAAEKALGRTA